jgi:P pilus assembly chaperone PapD
MITRVFLFIIFIVPIHASFATASLSFSPQRIVLEGHSRSATIRLTNRGDKPGTFRVSLSDVIYAADGSIKHTQSTPKGFPSARPFVRFSPSQVRLAPGETQRVRILLRSAQNIPQGELRIHAVLRQLPEATPIEKKATNEKVVKATLSITQATALPIIIRRGKVSISGGIASLQHIKDSLNVRLFRSGNYSLYTNIEVYSGTKSATNRVALVRGVAVPVPNRQRLIKIKLKGNGLKGPYIVVLKDHDTAKIIAEKRVQ